jgi:hypothetical protein
MLKVTTWKAQAQGMGRIPAERPAKVIPLAISIQCGYSMHMFRGELPDEIHTQKRRKGVPVLRPEEHPGHL